MIASYNGRIKKIYSLVYPHAGQASTHSVQPPQRNEPIALPADKGASVSAVTSLAAALCSLVKSRSLHLYAQVQIHFFAGLLEIGAFVIECRGFFALENRVINCQTAKKAIAS
jgi:hypothetical protein